jgi:hypothetical protein
LQTGNHFCSFNNVQQDISNQPTEIFKQVLASSNKLEPAQQQNLETLLFSFPQCGLLRAIQARTGDARQLNEAAAWFSDSTALHRRLLFATPPLSNRCKQQLPNRLLSSRKLKAIMRYLTKR